MIWWAGDPLPKLEGSRRWKDEIAALPISLSNENCKYRLEQMMMNENI